MRKISFNLEKHYLQWHSYPPHLEGGWIRILYFLHSGTPHIGSMYKTVEELTTLTGLNSADTIQCLSLIKEMNLAKVYSNHRTKKITIEKASIKSSPKSLANTKERVARYWNKSPTVVARREMFDKLIEHYPIKVTDDDFNSTFKDFFSLMIKYGKATQSPTRKRAIEKTNYSVLLDYVKSNKNELKIALSEFFKKRSWEKKKKKIKRYAKKKPNLEYSQWEEGSLC